MEHLGIIYKATNIVNGKVYIGQTTQGLDVRSKRHIRESKHTSRIIFQRALRKYGSDNFKWEVLEHCIDSVELDEMEFHYIMQYDSFNSGYNMTINTKCQAGELNPNYGNSMPEHSKNLISKFNKNQYKDKNNHPFYGKKHSDEAKEKMKAAHCNRKPISDLTRNKMSVSQTGRKHTEATKLKCSLTKIGINNYFFGKTLSDKHKEKISAKVKGTKNPFYGKKHSDDAKRKMRESWKRRKAKQVEAN